MTNNLTLALIILIFILLVAIVNIVASIIERRKLITKINTLWDNKSKLESFIRPNSRFDAQYQTYKDEFEKKHPLIDDKTWSDLNLSALFHKINFNFTAIGEMKLYATLRSMFKIEDQSLIQRYNDDKSFRLNVSYILSKIGKNVYPLFPDQLSPISRNNLLMFCPLLPIVTLPIMFISPGSGLFLFIGALILNVTLSMNLKKTYDQDLKSIFYTANVIKQCLALSKLEGTPELDVNFNHFKTSRRFSGFLSKIESPDFVTSSILFVKLIFMIDYVLFHLIQHSYFKYQDEVTKCYDYISTLDNHYSLAMYRRTLSYYCEPDIDESVGGVHFQNLIHPLIDEDVAVPNDLNLDNHILLTGSNASGKSTFMKAVALNIIMSQSLRTATADTFKCKPGYVYTSMANADDVLSGDSYFMAELKSIRRLFNIDTLSTVYCFIDEIFKGTNTTERIAASESVLSYLNALPNYQVVAATHDIELSSLLERDYHNYHFNESINNNEIYFDYKIKPGKANTRNAIELLRITQFPNAIYERAKEQVKE
ncbi:MutS family DNA mismatch repair protein [Staphylococcus caprae]|uniref:MutS-related protein n=1 Tax=Staphylococcus caprae TaxID=29380 RepID=UPI001F5A01D1|nr:MutS family DNA mismatch repair protein [Staphylococcus caprae]MCI2955949.1 MutS family DNA mismatch repair protein [Staphylococcus caprae]